jgi:hypothetical protein
MSFELFSAQRCEAMTLRSVDRDRQTRSRQRISCALAQCAMAQSR